MPSPTRRVAPTIFNLRMYVNICNYFICNNEPLRGRGWFLQGIWSQNTHIYWAGVDSCE